MPFPTLSSGGVKFLVYKQTTPNATWVIVHNFGRKPVVEVRAMLDGDIFKTYPSAITHTSDNIVTVTWSQAFEGEATLVCDSGT